MKHILEINLRACATLSLLTALAAPVQSQVATGEQLLSRIGINPTVAADGRNGFVLGWRDQDAPGSSGIFAATLPQGALAPRKPFQVNTTTAGDQIFPAVAADAGGRFIFVWQDGAQFDPSVAPRDLGQAFGAGGGRQSPEIQLSPGGAGQITPQVAMMDGGRFVAAWVEPGLPRYAVKAARFSAGGVRQGAEIALKARGDQNNLVGVAAFPGGFAVAWNEFYECHLSSTGGFVGAVARFDAAGRSLGPDVRVGSPDCDATVPAGDVAALVGSRAGLLAVFFGNAYFLAQRFDPSTGAPTGGQFRIPRSDCKESHCVLLAALTMDNFGRFAVIWETDDFNRFSLAAQLFNPRGKPITGRIAVSDDTSGSFETPAAALADDGTLAVVWRRELGSVNATDGLYLRRIALGGQTSE
jgi:hypothetical protein